MVHPGDLLRTRSDAERFTAPVGNLHLEPPDCGIKLLPWMAERLKLDKYNRNSVFVAFLSLLTVLHACATSYFIGTAKVWRLNYKISEATAEWIVYLGPICGGMFSLALSHYGNIIHRPCYIGGLAMLHAIGGWLLIVPELYHPSYLTLNNAAVVNQTLCRPSVGPFKGVDSFLTEEFDEGKSYIALTMLGIYQLVHGLAFVSMVSHGIAHIDDGTNKYATPTFICLLVAASQIGRFIGLNLTLIPVVFNRHIFFSIAWLITMTGIFILGFLISLFSRLPQRILLRQGVNTLLHRQSRQGREGRQEPNQEPQAQEGDAKELGYWAAVSSLFKTDILLLNTLAATFMNVATINFNAMREEFYRARQVNFADDFDYHFSFYSVSALLFMCVIVLVMAQIFYRVRPSTKFLVIWNLVVYIAIAGFFSSYAFLKCEDKTTLLSYNQVIGECNAMCQCSADVFEPVCLGGRTYYSPCFAGCKKRDDNIFSFCTCDSGPDATATATAGSCNQKKCQVVAFFAEANSVITFGLQVSTFIVHVIISLRGVEHHQLRASGIGLLLFGIQLLPYLPFKIIYELIKATHCATRISDGGDCFIFTEHFALVISLVTLGFMLLSIIMAACMLRGAGRVNLYKRRGSRQLGLASMRINEGNGHELDTLQEGNEDAENEESETPSSHARNGNSIHNHSENGTAQNGSGDGHYRSYLETSDVEVETDDEQTELRKKKQHEQTLRESLDQVYASATSSNRDVDSQFGSRRTISSNESRRQNQTSRPDESKPKTNEYDSEGYKLESTDFGDSDIDRELARIEREDMPKCLKRQSSLEETNL